MNRTQNSSDICNDENTVVLLDPQEAANWVWNDVDTLIITVIVPLVSAVGIIGNTAFLLSIFTIKHMQTSLNAYLCNLAVSDVMLLLSVVGWSLSVYTSSPISLSTSLHSHGACIGMVLSTHPWYFASLGFITLISIERFFAVCYPLKHLTMKGAARTAKISTTVWIMSVLLSATFIPRYVHHEKCLVWPEDEMFKHLPTQFHICTALNDLSTSVNLVEIGSFVVCFIVNFVLYTLIIKALSSRAVARRPEQKLENDVVRNQVARTLIINGVVFFLCQVPLRFTSIDFFLDHVFGFKDLLDRKQYAVTLTIGRGFLLLNSCINPFLYIFISRHYRRAIYDTFKTLSRSL
ncbi:kappa-type opioid receptor-like [Amphiura filiformis]|uniref:kappa-type opioid receptor-like n=1 Tax=Amphiura filiformis TaxID=82378 RepID=UPI003B224859